MLRKLIWAVKKIINRLAQKAWDKEYLPAELRGPSPPGHRRRAFVGGDHYARFFFFILKI